MGRREGGLGKAEAQGLDFTFLEAEMEPILLRVLRANVPLLLCFYS